MQFLTDLSRILHFLLHDFLKLVAPSRTTIWYQIFFKFYRLIACKIDCVFLHQLRFQYFGGTNFGRTAGGPLIATSYDYDAPLDEYGIVTEITIRKLINDDSD